MWASLWVSIYKHGGLFHVFSICKPAAIFVLKTNAEQKEHVVNNKRMRLRFFSGQQTCTLLPSGYSYCCCSPPSTLAFFPQRVLIGGGVGFNLFILPNSKGSLNPLPCQLDFSFLVVPSFDSSSSENTDLHGGKKLAFLGSACFSVGLHEPMSCKLFMLAEWRVKYDGAIYS